MRIGRPVLLVACAAMGLFAAPGSKPETLRVAMPPVSAAESVAVGAFFSVDFARSWCILTVFSVFAGPPFLPGTYC